jgi:hypothetical protein
MKRDVIIVGAVGGGRARGGGAVGTVRWRRRYRVADRADGSAREGSRDTGLHVIQVLLRINSHLPPSISNLPLVALGASSGGYFVSRLASKMHLAAVVIMIAERARSADRPPRCRRPIQERHDIEVMELQRLELPLTPTLLSERINDLDSGLSRIWTAFKEEVFIDDNGYMREDGRSTPWKDALLKKRFLGGVSDS